MKKTAIYNKKALSWTSEKISKILFEKGREKMLDNSSFAELVIPKSIFNKLIENDSLKASYKKRGYRDLIGQPFFRPQPDNLGQLYSRHIVRVWDEDRLLEHMKAGRRICS